MGIQKYGAGEVIGTESVLRPDMTPGGSDIVNIIEPNPDDSEPGEPADDGEDIRPSV